MTNIIPDGCKLLTGPTQYLNTSWDGPFAQSDADQVMAFDLTYWLWDCANDATLDEEEGWGMWADAEHIMQCFDLIWEDQDGNEHRAPVTKEQLTPRGVAILNTACSGESVLPVFKSWQNDIEAR